MSIPWEDNKDGSWRDRYRSYTTSLQVFVRPLYYRMVPTKDPDRQGRKWFDEIRATMPDSAWERENEIYFSSATGGLIYRTWNARIHHLVDAPRLREDWLYYSAIDPGVGVTAALWYAITPDSYHFLIDEYYAGDLVKGGEALAAAQHAQAIKLRTQMLCDLVIGTTKGGSSRQDAQRWIQQTLIDPSAFRRDSDLSQVGQRYVDAGISTIMPANNEIAGGIERVKELELLRPGVRHPNGLPGDSPLKYSYPHLKHYYWEKRHWKYKTGTETPEDKNNHLMDDERYLCVHVRRTPRRAMVQQEMTGLDRRLHKLRQTTNRGSIYERI